VCPAGSGPVTQPTGYVTIRQDLSLFLGYLRAFKVDGSRTRDPQRDTPAKDRDSGRRTDRPWSATCLSACRRQ
jgi:hypothetical protein